MTYNIIGQREGQDKEVLDTVHNRATAERLIREQYSMFNEGNVKQWTFTIEQCGSSVEW
jgi:hypothetical protein